MAYPSVTNTFTNGTTADGTEVNINFTDIINGFSDGTKDLNMNIGTFAGTVTMNGAVTLGNGSGDDLTFNGSIASSIPIKTTHTYDIGSATLGLKDIYLGSSAGAFTTKLSGADVAASKTVNFWGYSVTLPTADGTAGHVLSTNGSGTVQYQNNKGSESALNYSLTAVVDGANGMDITLKGADGNDLSATNVAEIVFRNATDGTGTPVTRRLTANVTAKIDSGATLGQQDGVNANTYIYLLDNAGTVELAVSSVVFDEDTVLTTTGLGAGSDSDNVIYSETGRANVPIKRIGHFESTQATAGTWLTNPSAIYLGRVGRPRKQYALTVTGTNWTTTHATGMPYNEWDDASSSYLWRFKFNITGTLSAGATTLDLTIAGVTFPAGYDQAVALSPDGIARSAEWNFADANTSVIKLRFSASHTIWYVSGDVRLKERPTFVQ